MNEKLTNTYFEKLQDATSFANSYLKSVREVQNTYNAMNPNQLLTTEQ